jgi:hypothetical protein
MAEISSESGPDFDDVLAGRLALVAASFERLLGRPLVAAPTPERLWNAPCVIVAHGREADPVFFYGNRRALEAFAMDFRAFCQLPSRYSAEPLARDERARLLERVSRDGFIDDYSGVRISAAGQRFRIEQAVVWNLIDEHGVCHGQAATFDRWQML